MRLVRWAIASILVFVAKQASSDATARKPLRRVVSRLALLGVGLGIIGGVTACIDIATRPPCDPGYVRLIDFQPVVATLGFALAGLFGLVYWRSRRGSHLRLMTGVLVVMLICVAYVDLVAVANVVTHYGQSSDSDCWTF